MRVRKIFGIGWLLCATLLTAPGLIGQGRLADYQRANGLRELTRDKVFRDRVEAHWLSDNAHFWYRVEIGTGRHQFVLVDADGGDRRPAFDHARLAQALAAIGVQAAGPEQLPIDRLEFDLERGCLLFRCGDRWLRFDLDGDAVVDAPAREIQAAGRPVGRGPDRSRRTGAETGIVFVNAMESDVELFWLDPDGARRSYGRLAPGQRRAQHTFAGHVWLAADEAGEGLAVFVALEQETVAEIEGRLTGRPGEEAPPAGRRPPDHLSPDGRYRVEVRDHDLVLIEVENGREFALTQDGTEADGYGGRLLWSPDSSRLVAVRTQAGDRRQVHYVEAAPGDQLQPRLHSYEYLKPGDQVPVDRPQLFDVANRRQIEVRNDLFENPFQLSRLRFAPDSSEFTFLYNQRGHQVLRIVAVDAKDGAARAVVDEQSRTFVDYAGKQFAHDLDATRELIWMSERDGWNHLYLYDAATGRVKQQITSGDWVVRQVDQVDEERRQIWFRAGGIRPEQDPYHVHDCRVNFDGTGLVVLTEGDGTHSVEFSPDRRFFLDRWSRVDLPPITELRRAEDGSLVVELERADWSALLETGWRPPARFVAKARDGTTDIYGVVFRPSNHDPRRRYPVIEEIYAGPQGAFVPKAFAPYHAAQSMAELGFIVVKIDGLGTSQRSKAFHDVCWKNLGDSGFPDRILWIQAAAREDPSMDLTRVGIYGGSAGGQSSTRALLAHGDFYHVAVSDCGCHDNRMDKLWWNELWMGWPVGPHYAEQSNVTQAHRLTGKLLLIVGGQDRNVDPASTMQVVDALIQADRDFDLLVIPGAGHGAAETPYGRRRRQDYFVRNLLGVEPRRE